MGVNRIWMSEKVTGRRRPRSRLPGASGRDIDLEVVYDRIADLASDYLIRESGCVPPPRTRDRSPLIDTGAPLPKAESLWMSFLSGLGGFMKEVLFGRGRRESA